MLRYSELYFTQYSAYIKLSAQNYILHVRGEKRTIDISRFLWCTYSAYLPHKKQIALRYHG